MQLLRINNQMINILAIMRVNYMPAVGKCKAELRVEFANDAAITHLSEMDFSGKVHAPKSYSVFTGDNAEKLWSYLCRCSVSIDKATPLSERVKDIAAEGEKAFEAGGQEWADWNMQNNPFGD